MDFMEFVGSEIKRLKEIKCLTPYAAEKLHHLEQSLDDYILRLKK